MRMLKDRGITNQVFFNPLKYADKTRISSGEWKASVINAMDIHIHFEDDEIQAEVIRNRCYFCKVVLLSHDLVEKENKRQEEFR